MENSTAASAAVNTAINSNNSTTPAAAAAANSHLQNSLRSLNKSSYKISKPPPSSSRNPNPTLSPNPPPPTSNPNPNPTPTLSPNPPPPSSNPNPNPSPQSQPPVYNIDKSNFREIVQKLTGSPAHRHPPGLPAPAGPPPPPPPPAPSATTSRLHRIRPPPLSNLTSLPPAVGPSLSPLPPLPTVSAAAESPITAYMRRLRGGPSPTAAAALPPLSPLGFGCYGMMLSPSLLMPTSPRLPLPSPR